MGRRRHDHDVVMGTCKGPILFAANGESLCTVDGLMTDEPMVAIYMRSLFSL